MAVALETRAPFLDHELVEMISRLPPSVRVGAKPKQLLKDILYKYVPPEMIERPKMGFGIPLRSWMQNEMKEQMYDLLSPDRIKRQGLFSPEVCQNLLDRFYLKKEPIENLLWPLLVFQKWHQHWQ
jgi:asparagine synthase (glutamine-hydrolysing)